ncbi:MAG: hypothetical protein QOD26_1590 [Betaproteobacteria bacterium]|jgi:hypothetical protein|nr:hypothetical protein [Betaproteobacteria bacterium]
MKTSTFALLAGLAYLGAGLLGLVPVTLMPPPLDAPPTSFAVLYGYLLGLFPVNIVLSLVHLAIGVWGITAWRSANPALFARGAALLFGVLAVLGMIPLLNTVFGWIPIHGHDVWLHGFTAALAAYFGWRNEIEPAERRSTRMDRRFQMRPVAQDRRHGGPDRRFAHARMMAGV